MRTIITLCFVFSVYVVGWAQQIDSPNRDITLKVLDKKGRPVRNILALSIHTGKAGITDRSGIYVFEDIADDDTLSLQIKRNGYVIIPVAGMDSIVVNAVSSKLYSYFDHNGHNTTVQIDLLAPNPNVVLDVQEILRQQAYGSLSELLRGRVSGINVSFAGSNDANLMNTSAVVRGPNSITGSSEPLVVLDGIELGTLATANLMVNIYSVKTIEVQKNASGWGVRGSNGVILITSM